MSAPGPGRAARPGRQAAEVLALFELLEPLSPEEPEPEPEPEEPVPEEPEPEDPESEEVDDEEEADELSLLLFDAVSEDESDVVLAAALPLEVELRLSLR